MPFDPAAWELESEAIANQLALKLTELIKERPEIYSSMPKKNPFKLFEGCCDDGPCVWVVIGEWARVLDLKTRIYLLGRRRPVFIYSDEKLTPDNWRPILVRLLKQQRGANVTIVGLQEGRDYNASDPPPEI
jgi:hypothetical protein